MASPALPQKKEERKGSKWKKGKAYIRSVPVWGAPLNRAHLRAFQKREHAPVCQGRASLGVRRTTPVDIVAAESGLIPASVRERSGLGRRETVEEQRWDALRVFRGGVCVDRKEETLEIAREWKDPSRTVWTDGSRLENGRVGATSAWWSEREGGWTGWGTYPGTNKEVFDAEVFAIL